MHSAQTLDSATVRTHAVKIKPEVFIDLVKYGIENRCFAMTKDATEAMVGLGGEMRDRYVAIRKTRLIKPKVASATFVSSYDLTPEDIVVLHYHCGIPPEPSMIDLETMREKLKLQIVSTKPGKPRIYAIASPHFLTSGFALDIKFFEPVPYMSITLRKVNLLNKDVFYLLKSNKGFAKYEKWGGGIEVKGEDDEPREDTLPFRKGDACEITVEDFIFIASYYYNTRLTDFPYLKLCDKNYMLIEVGILAFKLDEAVQRVLSWIVV